MRLFTLGVVSLLMAISTSAKYAAEVPSLVSKINVEEPESMSETGDNVPLLGSIISRPEKRPVRTEDVIRLGETGDNVPSLVSKINVEEPESMKETGDNVPLLGSIITRPKKRPVGTEGMIDLGEIGDNIPSVVSKVNVKEPESMKETGDNVPLLGSIITRPKKRPVGTEGMIGLGETGDNIPSVVSKVNVKEPESMKETGDNVPLLGSIMTRPKERPVGTEGMIGLGETVDVMKVECNSACPLIFKPVCGGLRADREETFSNECQLKVRNCLNRTKWEVLRPGKC